MTCVRYENLTEITKLSIKTLKFLLLIRFLHKSRILFTLSMTQSHKMSIMSTRRTDLFLLAINSHIYCDLTSELSELGDWPYVSQR